MTWVVLLAASAAFTAGWAAHGWTCSRRRDCPRYAEYALEKWKRDVEAQVTRHGSGPESRRRPTPPEGSSA